MAGGFTLADRDNTTFQAVMRQKILKPSTQFAGGDALIHTAGRLEKASTVTDTVDGILNAMITPPNKMRPDTAFLSSASGGEEGQYIPCRGNGLKFRTNLTGDDAPPVDEVAADATSTTSAVVVTHGTTTSNGDFTGGTLFCNGEQRTITSSTYSGGKHTFNLNKPLTSIATGDLVTVVPFAKGTRGVKLSAGASAAHRGIDPSVAGKSGGKVNIEEVFLKNTAGCVPHVYVSFQD
jgi:hypothetical protein